MLYGIVAQPKPAHSIQIYNHTALICCVYVYNKLNICSISTHPDDVSLLTLDLLWQLKGSTPVCSISIRNNNLCNKSTYIHALILINNCYGEGGGVLSASPFKPALYTVADRSHLEGQSELLVQNLSLSHFLFTLSHFFYWGGY